MRKISYLLRDSEHMLQEMKNPVSEIIKLEEDQQHAKSATKRK